MTTSMASSPLSLRLNRNNWRILTRASIEKRQGHDRVSSSQAVPRKHCSACPGGIFGTHTLRMRSSAPTGEGVLACATQGTSFRAQVPPRVRRSGSPTVGCSGATIQEALSPSPGSGGHLDCLELGEEIPGLSERRGEDLLSHVQQFEDHRIADGVDHAGPFLAGLNQVGPTHDAKLLGEVRRLETNSGNELTHGAFAVAQHLQDADTRRGAQRFEEVSFRLVYRCGHHNASAPCWLGCSSRLPSGHELRPVHPIGVVEWIY